MKKGKITDMEIVILILFALVTVGNIFSIAYNLDKISRYLTCANLALIIEIVVVGIWRAIKKRTQVDE